MYQKVNRGVCSICYRVSRGLKCLEKKLRYLCGSTLLQSAFGLYQPNQRRSSTSRYIVRRKTRSTPPFYPGQGLLGLLSLSGAFARPQYRKIVSSCIINPGVGQATASSVLSSDKLMVEMQRRLRFMPISGAEVARTVGVWLLVLLPSLCRSADARRTLQGVLVAMARKKLAQIANFFLLHAFCIPSRPVSAEVVCSAIAPK